MQRSNIIQIVFLLFFSSVTFADNEPNTILPGYAVIYELADDWQVYDEKYQSYVPYVQERHQESKAMSFWLDVETYRNYYLTFYAYKNTYLFINQKLYKKFVKDQWIFLLIKDLDVKNNTGLLFCTFYDEYQRLPLPSLFVGMKQKEKIIESKKLKTPSLLENSKRFIHSPKYFVITIGLFVLLIYTIIINYSRKTFFSFYSLRSSISSLSRKDTNLINKPMNGVNLVFLLGFASLLSFFYVLSQVSTSPNFGLGELSTDYLFFNLFMRYLFYFGIAIALIFFKYIIINFFGLLLSIEKQALNVHFFEYMRLSMLFYSGALILPLFIFISQNHLLVSFYEFYTYVILVFQVIQLFLVSFYLIKQIQFISLYLFYYLCITELTPLLIGIKLLLF